MKDFTVIAWALVALAVAAWTEIFGWRQPIRDLLAESRAFLAAEWSDIRGYVAAFGREVRALWRWLRFPYEHPRRVADDEFGEHEIVDVSDLYSVEYVRVRETKPPRPRRKRRPKKD